MERLAWSGQQNAAVCPRSHNSAAPAGWIGDSRAGGVMRSSSNGTPTIPASAGPEATTSPSALTPTPKLLDQLQSQVLVPVKQSLVSRSTADGLDAKQVLAAAIRAMDAHAG